MSKILKNKNIQIGRSMIEMLGVLAIMAVITVLSIMAYTMGMRTVKVNHTKSDLAAISLQIDKIVGSSGDYSILGVGGDYTTFIPQKASFEKLFVKTGLFKNSETPFGGFYGVEDIHSWNDLPENAGKHFSYSISLFGFSQKDCLYLQAQNWGSDWFFGSTNCSTEIPAFVLYYNVI